MLQLESEEGERAVSFWSAQGAAGRPLSPLCAAVVRWNRERPDLPFSVRFIRAKQELGMAMSEEQAHYQRYLDRLAVHLRPHEKPCELRAFFTTKEALRQPLSPLETQVRSRFYAAEHPMHAWIWAKRDIRLELTEFQQRVFHAVMRGVSRMDDAVKTALAEMADLAAVA